MPFEGANSIKTKLWTGQSFSYKFIKQFRFNLTHPDQMAKKFYACKLISSHNRRNSFCPIFREWQNGKHITFIQYRLIQYMGLHIVETWKSWFHVFLRPQPRLTIMISDKRNIISYAIPLCLGLFEVKQNVIREKWGCFSEIHL